MKTFRSFLFSLVALLIANACSNNPEAGDIVDPAIQPSSEGTALDPATCGFQWYEPTHKLYEPQIGYDRRCAVGIFMYLNPDEKPDCWADDVWVEYYDKDVLVAKAEPVGGSWNRVYYSLYDEAGNTIFEARHNRIGDSDLPEYISYRKYEGGREVDVRADEIQHYDGVVLDHEFPSYLDYGTLVDPTPDPHDQNYFVSDTDGLFEGCSHLLSLTDQDPVAFPAENEIPNGGNCTMNVEHVRSDGKPTFVGEYRPKYGEWWPSTEYEYDAGGKLVKKIDHSHHSDGGYYLGITTYTYDEQGRPLSVDEDKGKEGADGGDGVIEDFEHYSWTSDDTATILTQNTGGGGKISLSKYVRTYDEKSRVVEEDYYGDGIEPDGQPKSRSIRKYAPDGRQYYFAYFAAKFKSPGGWQIPDTPEYSSGEEYDEKGRVVRTVTITNYSWDKEEQVSIHTYLYDGNRLVEERWSDSEYQIDSRTLYLYHCE